MNLRPLSTLLISILIMMKMRTTSDLAGSLQCSQAPQRKHEFKPRLVVRLNRLGGTQNQLIFHPDLASAAVKVRRTSWLWSLSRFPPIRTMSRFKKTQRAANGPGIGSLKVNSGI
jgi:hypothetical protein